MLLAAACGHKKPEDECAEVARKVRPVLAKMGTAADRPFSAQQLDEFSSGFCKEEGNADQSRTFRKCVLASDSDSETAACLKPLFDDYAKAMSDGVAKIEAKRAEREKELARKTEELERLNSAMADAAIAPPPDAAPARPRVTPVDVATLTAWPVPAGTKASGPALDVYAVDADADRVLGLVWERAYPLIAATKGGTLTGKIIGASKAEAAAAIAAAAGIQLAPVAIKGRGATVDFYFMGAPQRDLFHIFADVLKLNVVVAPGDLPKLDIVVRRKPADGVMDAVVAFDGRVTRRFANTAYVLPKDLPLPPLVKMKAGPIVDLEVKAGTAAEAFAALRAIAPEIAVGACDGTTFDLRIRRVPAAEAMRAIQVMSGATLVETGDGGCGIAKTDLTALPTDGVLTAVVQSGTRFVAVIGGAKPALIEKTEGVNDIGPGYATIGKTTLQLHQYDFSEPPHDAESWLASVVRTSAVMRQGVKWDAIFENTRGETVGYETDYPVFQFSNLSPTISEKGLEIAEPPAMVPLAKR
jgi:hypothetical protein